MSPEVEIITIWLLHEHLKRTSCSEPIFGKQYLHGYEPDRAKQMIGNVDWQYEYWLTRTKPHNGDLIEIHDGLGTFYPIKVGFKGKKEIFDRDIVMLRMFLTP